jgi:hypothetical protein
MSMARTRSELEAKRDELQERLDRIKADYRRGLDRDSQEQALELENREVLDEIYRVTGEELARVNAELADCSD